MSESGRGTPIGKRRSGSGFIRYALWYTLLFAAVGAAVFFPFARAGKSFVWVMDGVSQLFPKLAFFNETVRDGVSGLFSGASRTFSLFRFDQSGVAPDTQYGILQMLSALWPRGEIDSFYTVYVLLGYYLTGLAFVYFGWWFHQRRAYVLAGALTYSFCGFALFAGVRHPHFMMPMILLPLLIVGTEKVLRRERSWLLTVAVFLSMSSSFGVYFSCMQAVFVFLYVCVRFFDLYKTDCLREFVRLWGRLAVWGGTGVLLGCFTAFPTLLEILGGERIGADIWGYTDPLFYEKSRNLKFLTYFSVIPDAVSSWMRLGFSALCAPCVFLLFLRREKAARTLRGLFLLLTAMHMIPAVAYVMSGFSSVTNRFCFGYAFCVSAILMFVLPRLAEMSRRMGAVLGGIAAVYAGICVVILKDTQEAWIAAGSLLLALAPVYVCRFAFRQRLRRFLPVLCVGVTCACVAVSAFLLYDESEGNYVAQFSADPYQELASGQYASLGNSAKVTADDSSFRVMGDNVYKYDQNYAFHYGLSGLTAYPYYGQSTAYMAWLRELEAPRISVGHMMNAYVRQSCLLTLGNVKYYASRDSDEADWPYGFQKVDAVANGGHTDVILENENWLPLGYTYDRYISREEYDELDPLSKRAAMMQAAVLDTAPENVPAAGTEDLVFQAEQVPCRVVASEGISWKKGKLKVKAENATLTLTFEGLPETETYVRIVELDLTKGASTRSWSLTAETDRTSVSGTWHADAYVYANRQHTQLLDLGYSKEGMTSVTLRFPKKGTFKLEDLQIWCQDMGGFADQAAALRAEPLEDIETNWRGLTGTVTVPKDKILCLSLPWLDGWTAYVDGEEVPLYHANTAFMGIELPAGEHSVELRYWLPGLTAGLILTGLGLVCLAGLAVFDRRRSKGR